VAWTDSDRLPSRPLDLRLGASVHTADGHHVGTLERIVVDAESWDPHALIVRETNHFSGRNLAPGAGMMVAEVIVPLDVIRGRGTRRDPAQIGSTSDAIPCPHTSATQYKTLERGDGLRFAAALAGGSLGVGPMFPLLTESADKPAGDIEIRHGEKRDDRPRRREARDGAGRALRRR